MTTCTPKCLQDTDCSQMGGICCPNQCNTKSCARPKTGSQGSSSGSYKGSASKRFYIISIFAQIIIIFNQIAFQPQQPLVYTAAMWNAVLMKNVPWTNQLNDKNVFDLKMYTIWTPSDEPDMKAYPNIWFILYFFNALGISNDTKIIWNQLTS